MSAALDLLRKGRALIANVRRWTECAYARDRAGQPVDAWQPEAVCWCAYGALERGGVTELSDHARDYLREAAAELFQDSPATVNDDIGHAAVLRMYDRAIELAVAS